MRLPAEALRQCCNSRRWVELMLASDSSAGGAQALLAASDRAFDMLCRTDWLEAFAAHSAIGAPRADDLIGTAEQAAVQDDDGTRMALVAANVEYQRRFGFVFLIRAASRSGDEILAALHDRLDNSPEMEFVNACDQQREITALRLASLLPA
jgi:OHCU decarboxylase